MNGKKVIITNLNIKVMGLELEKRFLIGYAAICNTYYSENTEMLATFVSMRKRA